MNWTEAEERIIADARVCTLYLDPSEARLVLHTLEGVDGLEAVRARLDRLIKEQGE
jgi:hypothetical protein